MLWGGPSLAAPSASGSILRLSGARCQVLFLAESGHWQEADTNQSIAPLLSQSNFVQNDINSRRGRSRLVRFRNQGRQGPVPRSRALIGEGRDPLLVRPLGGELAMLVKFVLN